MKSLVEKEEKSSKYYLWDSQKYACTNNEIISLRGMMKHLSIEKSL